nr:hypothetical protein [Clavibacter michiganensis]
MTDTLLRSLRERLLDESESLAGLLRKCLLLGAETGSDALRQWARYELNGYDDAVELPSYRKLPTPPISVDSFSGNTWAKNVPYSRLQLPPAARECIGEEFLLYQPIEELQSLSAQGSLSFTGTGLSYAQHLWNKELGPFQQIIGMSFMMSGSAISGVLGKIRTQLVDIVADLTADTPLAELPEKEQVDAAVGQHIGTQYNTTIHAANGPTAIGTNAAASTGLSVDDAVRLLDAVRVASDGITDQGAKVELLQAVDDLRTEVENPLPDTGAVVKKAGKLRAAAASVAVPAVSAAVGGAVEAITSLAMSGAFG